jgi:site-specific recombinase XerD
MQGAEELEPRPAIGAQVPTVDDAASSLRERLELRGRRKSYRQNCEYMQRVHISPSMGERKVTEIDRADVEALARMLLKKGLAPKSVRNIMGFLHGVFEHALDRGWVRENRCEELRSRVASARGPIQICSSSARPSSRRSSG